MAKFGHGGENINGVDVKVGDPQFTLIWDSRADIDLHVVEPGGSEIYWENRNGGQGGELDVDDVDGFGPENFNYVLGKGPPGTLSLVRPLLRRPRRAGPDRPAGRSGSSTPGKIEIYPGEIQRDRPEEPGLQAEGRPRRRQDRRRPPTPATMPEGGRIGHAPAAPRRSGRRRPPAPPAAAGPRLFAPPGAGFSVDAAVRAEGRAEGLGDPPRPGRRPGLLARPGGGRPLARDARLPRRHASPRPTRASSWTTCAKAVADAKGTPTRQAKIALSGSAGREAEFTLPDSVVAGGGLGKARTTSPATAW